MIALRFFVIPALFALAAPLAAAEQQFKVDPVHSNVIFKINHFGISDFLGRFDKISGTITWDETDPTKNAVTFVIQSDSIDTNFPQRDQHTRSADFLDAKQFPEITFKSTSFKKTGDAEYAVDGELTLHGVTKPMTVTIKKTGEGKDPTGAFRVGFWSTFTIKRSDFGMKFMSGALGDAIEVMLSSEGTLTDGK